MTQPYHGYPNYVTWAVKSWIDSDSINYKYWCDMADKISSESVHSANRTQQEVATSTLAFEIKSSFEHSKPHLNDVWADILAYGLCEVHWRDIANSYFEKEVS